MSPQELQLMRQDLRKQKQKLTAENLPMTESEAVKFWAAYQKYSKELQEINDEKFEIIHFYAQNWCSMSNEDAVIFMRRWPEIDEKVTQLRSKYFLVLMDALPGKKAATFFQLNQRISMMINLEMHPSWRCCTERLDKDIPMRRSSRHSRVEKRDAGVDAAKMQSLGGEDSRRYWGTSPSPATVGGGCTDRSPSTCAQPFKRTAAPRQLGKSLIDILALI
jgi:hypothetical protein